MKRGTSRYRASVTVQGVTRQKIFQDNSQKSKREAYLWEGQTKKEQKEIQSQTSTTSLAAGEWINQYLEEAEQRFAKVTFDEKKAVFTRFFKNTGLLKNSPIEEISLSICRNYLVKQNRERSGNAANKDRKNLGTAWKWGSDYLEGWPKGFNPFLSIKKYPEKREPRYVPPEEERHRKLSPGSLTGAGENRQFSFYLFPFVQFQPAYCGIESEGLHISV